VVAAQRAEQRVEDGSHAHLQARAVGNQIGHVTGDRFRPRSWRLAESDPSVLVVNDDDMARALASALA
jgi:hypothetical protein